MTGTHGDDDVSVAAAAGVVAAATDVDAAAAADLHPIHYRMLGFAAVVAFFRCPWT